MDIILVAAFGRGDPCGKPMPIGAGGMIPWLGKMPVDMKRFRELTLGKTVVMGRKTFASIGKALPKRKNIVLTRDPNFKARNVRVAPDIASVLKMTQGLDELFVIGGGEIYREFLPLATRLELTAIDLEFAGDTFFPDYRDTGWKVVSAVDHEPDKKNLYWCRFLTLKKKSP